MSSSSVNLMERFMGALRSVRSNILITTFCMLCITAMDLLYSSFVNERYAFDAVVVLHSGYWFTVLTIFIGTFLGRVFFSILLALIFLMSVVQIISFEYFGSYILPIHFIQLAPDFLLIMASLYEVLDEVLPILIVSAFVLALAIAVLIPLARKRMAHSRAALLILILMGSDIVGNYTYLSINREKLGEPAFKNLLPDVNQLGISNAYRSARYLLIGILPDRLAGKLQEQPALPEPVRIAEPDVNIVVIMNESVRAKSLSLLGYELDTTPRLQTYDDLYATSIYSAGTMTRTSFAGLVHRLKYPGMGKQYLSQSNCLFRLAKSNGFKTHFIYSPGQQAVQTMLPLMCANYIDEVKVNTDAPAEMQPFDESILYHLQNIDLDQKNFIMIGPTGAHTPYGDKSPAEFKKFGLEYDNAVHYTDHVVAGVIDYLRQHSTKPTYVLMTSDHGELLKDEDEKRGHGWFKNEVVIVPFLFMPMNDPNPAETMAEVERVRSHFDIATLVTGLLGYDVTVEDPSEKEIYINGSDLSGLAGQIRLRFSTGTLHSVELINGIGAVPGPEEFSRITMATRGGFWGADSSPLVSDLRLGADSITSRAE